jgi:signal transduction histidine kinase
MNASTVSFRAELLERDIATVTCDLHDAYINYDAKVIAWAKALTFDGTRVLSADDWHGADGALAMMITAITAGRKVKDDSAKKTIKRAIERIAEIRETAPDRCPPLVIPAKPAAATPDAERMRAKRANVTPEEQKAKAALEAIRAKRKETEAEERERVRSARDACTSKIRLIEDPKILARIEAAIDREAAKVKAKAAAKAAK